jgi:hypothetical protein
MKHPLHFAVAAEIEHRLDGKCRLIKDPACGGNQHIPLFIGNHRSRETRTCMVDLLVVLNESVKVIIEIEESGFLPTKICGKFLQAALSTHLIHDSQLNGYLSFADQVLFVQVLDGSKCLKVGTRKDRQADLIAERIRNLLPLKESNISDYRLFFVKGVDDCAGLEIVAREISTYLRGEKLIQNSPS